MNSIVKQIIREYDKDLTNARNELEIKKEQLYDKIPRLLEIDDLLNETGYSVAKAILLKDGDTNNLVDELKFKNDKLIKEKNSLLTKYGYREDYLEPKYKCSKCSDTGFVNNVKCECFKQKLINKYYDLSNLKDVLNRENFNKFSLKYYSNEPFQNYKKTPRESMEINLKAAKLFVNEFDKSFVNLLLSGSTGLGKTFLCNCIAKEILDKGKLVLYLTASELFKAVEDERFNKDQLKQEDYIDFIYNVDLLILDDLGTEVNTIVTSSELLNIVNYRLVERKPTIISTNLSSANFKDGYSDRLTSRLVGYYKLLYFYGDDIRLMKKYSSYVLE